MDKYSLKIKNITDNLSIKNVNINKSIFINKLFEIIQNTYNPNLNIPNYTIKHLKKIHSIEEDSLLYKFYKLYKPYDIKSLKDFVKFYIENNLTEIEIIKENIKDNTSLLNKFNEIYFNKDDRDEIKNIFYHNIFVSIDILHELESFDLKCIEIDDSYFRLNLYYYDIDNIDEHIRNIINIINIIKQINNSFQFEPVKIYNVILFLGNQKKYLFGNKITPMNMNSGSTIKDIYVSVWRKEEYEKVLIHELCHYISVDFDIFLNKKINNDINNLFNLHGINHVSESYNETVAGIINMCYKSVKLNIDLNEIYLIETKFLLFQTIKLIKFFGGNDIFTMKIYQNTSCLSYIILKFILFYNINDFINLLDEFNIICNSSKKINIFNKFLLDIIKKKDYLNDIEKNINFVINNWNNKFVYKTLRMSAI